MPISYCMSFLLMETPDGTRMQDFYIIITQNIFKALKIATGSPKCISQKRAFIVQENGSFYATSGP